MMAKPKNIDMKETNKEFRGMFLQLGKQRL